MSVVYTLFPVYHTNERNILKSDFTIEMGVLILFANHSNSYLSMFLLQRIDSYLHDILFDDSYAHATVYILLPHYRLYRLASQLKHSRNTPRDWS